ncbi:hypothetical protein F1188_03850 [Roseospira marina]|uniref:Magnetosome protein MamS/MamX domain-containing protein n=1 Tax=Roseospira marina TaxID=140057 RepID=A0A5M6IH18_9PROT|nr:hypothetical protein [Roseospira marina]KAA5607049.1 hypothetical protein F1188_03850 [Roseospira marina]MBB4312763.1 hypothetical protein [Roseospira marina]MBB5086464.1 hypothetical protein [Roseospira marina]
MTCINTLQSAPIIAAPMAAPMAALLGLGLLLAGPAQAQRGLGDAEGIVRQGTPTTTKAMAGRVVAVEDAPCAMTTGRASVGAHLILDTDDGTRINLHLGPVAAVPDLLDAVTPGTRIETETFRTEAMPADAAIARTVQVGDLTFELRDAALRPRWRIGASGRGAGMGGGMGMGSGMGPGRGMGAAPGSQPRDGTGMGPCGW